MPLGFASLQDDHGRAKGQNTSAEARYFKYERTVAKRQRSRAFKGQIEHDGRKNRTSSALLVPTGQATEEGEDVASRYALGEWPDVQGMQERAFLHSYEKKPLLSKFAPRKALTDVPRLEVKCQQMRARQKRIRADPPYRAFRKHYHHLPIWQRSKVINRLIRQSPTAVLVSEKDAGKSLGLAHVILREWVDVGRGAFCNIVVARRNDAECESTAARLTQERGEALGTIAGTWSKRPIPNGSICFVEYQKLLPAFETKQLDDPNNPLGTSTHLLIDDAETKSEELDQLIKNAQELAVLRAKAGRPLHLVIMVTLPDCSSERAIELACQLSDPMTQGPAPTMRVTGGPGWQHLAREAGDEAVMKTYTRRSKPTSRRKRDYEGDWE